MSKKFRYVLFVLLLIVPLALAACGGDDDDKDNGSNGDDVSLDQTFESDLGLTVSYPEGWAAAEDVGQIMLANSQDTLDMMQSGSADAAPESGQVGVMVVPLPLVDLGMDAEASLDTVFDMMVQGMTGEGMETRGDAEDVTVDGKEAKRLAVKDADTGSDGMIWAFNDEDGAVVMVIMITAEGEADNYTATVEKIAASADWSAPAD